MLEQSMRGFTCTYVTRDNSQRVLAQHSVATLLRYCFKWLQHCSNIAKLCYAKNRRYELSRLTSPSDFLRLPYVRTRWTDQASHKANSITELCLTSTFSRGLSNIASILFKRVRTYKLRDCGNPP